MSLSFEDALSIVENEPVIIRDGVRMVQVVVPFTEKYRKEFDFDLLSNKYQLKSKDSKIYAKDNKFNVGQYNQKIMDEIFKLT